ncbi:TniQ family protein [Flavobacterium sp. CFS9]|uniref:TniQ family protein n=1 Tax=Flavobacterium sp. CFS9 TaxID=3143118 RepID=UPI0034E8409D
MVLIKNKNIWPAYIHPQKDELFSSWLCRLSAEHQIKVYSFLKIYFKSSNHFLARNVDLIKPNEIINGIVNHSLLNKREADNLFLTSYEGIIFEKANCKTYTIGLLPLGISNQKRKNFGTLYCPSCLNKKIPYFKKQWRLSISLVCLDCNIRLKEKCDNCNNPITYHLTNLSKNTSDVIHPLSLKYCLCGYDLSQTNIKDELPTAIEIEYQKFINQTISDGYNSISSFSFLFFEGFIMLLTKYLSSSKNNRFRSGLLLHYKKNNIPSVKKDFGLWSIEKRRIAIIDVFPLFENYPTTLNTFLKKHRIYKSYIRNDNNYPYWFLSNFT